ncbi:hypothetical protein ACLBKU_15060 [Erythrobacter sp. NE805]|uniref:hypothetical protein n=1 Tax=Erythrobacter sp. NE805 TaxID=3389875 RepID=UPI00396B2681
MKIGQVFATSFAMFRQRFWPLVGLWAVFLVIQIAGTFALGILGVVLGMQAITAGATGGLEEPGALAGMGIGMIVFLVLFYAAYLVVFLAQQAALVTLASPLEEPAFGAALAKGFRSALPFFAMTLVGVIAWLAFVAVTDSLAALAGDAGAAVEVVVALAVLPLLAWLGCRLAVLVPVVAVEEVWNPLAALRRCWAVTRGRAGDVFLALLAFGAVSLAAVGVPFLVFLYAVGSTSGEPETAVWVVLGGLLLFIPLLIAFSIYAPAFIAAMHSEMTGGGAESLEEVFA